MTTLDEVQALIGGRRYGSYIAANCIFHDDTHPSLLIFSDGFHCKGCGKTGTLDELKSHLTHFTGVERKLKNKNFSDFRNPFSRWLQEKSIPDFCYEAHDLIKRFPSQAHYLIKRKIDHMIDELQLGWWEGWYIFPVKNEFGEIANVVARADESIQQAKDIRYILPNHSEPMLYVPNWIRVKFSDKLYVVYGIIDAITLHSLGFPVVTGINGKFNDPDLLRSFRKPIIVVPDLGEESDALKLASRLSWRGSVRRLQYPEGAKDPADIYQKFGSQSLLTALA